MTKPAPPPSEPEFSGPEREELALLVDRALAEDGPDRTSAALIPAGLALAGTIVARGGCILAGLPAAAEVAARCGAAFAARCRDGDEVAPNGAVADLAGSARAVLRCERVLLNFLGRLSGIATLTRRYARALHPTPVFDTRKTTPGWRRLEKYAVRAGGGRNHRLGLDDQFLVKDNHLAALAAAGGARPLHELVAAMRAAAPGLAIEIEVENEDDFRAAVLAGADIVMLDNWTTDAMRAALAWLDTRGARRVRIEISGGVTLARAPELAGLGADRVSVGALTHAAVWCDFALEVAPAGATGRGL
ncbi:MAG TPA: carboxylating nicotinate-nucleotide diphosphorylase [Planctomycetota bacterium]|jgi:nicotinate-nucleotide pyrophosphorylase (carboxylating)|nr:carboxylating nicotinate-nucleotide diphosphorylase [Planctomycetota bacterium]OQC19971.1 MAG: putative nicotinate-nucleotide pyrophosphorylase (carboxylating) [Planctomycetes bacterium ADurb.Bin069]HNR99517.1 carboxylating nicotinate-nucleotide diphosphorylase [Planctomycetota bacterium]HNU26574.1 carboxylating nicotinate-nucleotide diphosphorylase [Planctomycetota bacterium]HOE30481.1 carboxylating nicotinate-nucleotide diphosphorylase [Planctomycetota bacterium]